MHLTSAVRNDNNDLLNRVHNALNFHEWHMHNPDIALEGNVSGEFHRGYPRSTDVRLVNPHFLHEYVFSGNLYRLTLFHTNVAFHVRQAYGCPPFITTYKVA